MLLISTVTLCIEKHTAYPVSSITSQGMILVIFFQILSSLEKAPTVVAKSLEKFTAMNIGHIRIQDSLQFLNYSLDKLVSNLKDKGLKENKSLKDTFPTVYSYFKKKWSHLDEDVFPLLCRKGVYPYEYFDTFERFNETKLPEKENTIVL